MGVLFAVLIVRQTVRSARVYGWPSAPCTILSSGGRLDSAVPDTQPPYTFHALYRYLWQGREYSSDAFSEPRSRFTSWSDVRRLEKRFPPGSSATCHIDPQDPSYALLVRPSFWLALFLPIPLLFVAIGGGSLYFLWFRPNAQPVPRKKGTGRSLLLLFVALTLAGPALFFAVFAEPLRLMIASRSWPESECRVLFSRVGVHEDDESTGYSVDVLYSWQSAGREYRGSRYRFFDGSSSGRKSKQQRVDGFAPGSAVPCYVKPDDPEEAVLNREFSPFALSALIPVGLLVTGIFGLGRCVRR
jgi:hypothetical protein